MNVTSTFIFNNPKFAKNTLIMKLLSLSIILLFTSLQTLAQQNHFIYIQSDSKTSFTVNVNDHAYKSSDIGYVIIPKLTNNTYNLSITVADASVAPLTFQCKVNNNDQGFLLKNFSEKGWTLMNLQTMDLITAANAPAIDNKNNAFSDMLSDVVDDSTLNNPVVAIIPETKKDSVIAEVQTDVNSPIVESLPQTISSITNGKNTVTKIAAITDIAGTHYTFLDFDGIKTDTIFVTIPPNKENKAIEVKTENVIDPVIEEKETPEIKDTTSIVNNSDQSGNPFYQEKQEEEKPTEAIIATTPDAVNTPIRNECTNIFPEDDMDRLRKKMISQSSDEKMLSAAKKYVGDRCLSTAQVKELAGLFLNDESRYNLFSQFYTSVFDNGNYNQLATMLFDTYYKNRFDALIQQK